MERRAFVAQGVGAAVGLAACGLAPRERGRAAVSGERARTVVVIGAGLAGLAAAHELVRRGHRVTVLEARPVPGGRVQTVREPFGDGLYAEAGALFIPDNHDLVLRYVQTFGLPLREVVPRASGKFYYARGRRLTVAGSAPVDWPFDLTAEERRLGLSGMWRTYVTPAVTELGDVTAAGWPPAPLHAWDRMTGAEFLRSRGASKDAVALLGLGYLDLSGEGLDSYSALLMLRDLALKRGEKKTYAIEGGNDRLPRAFADALGERLLHGARVVRLEPGAAGVSVVTAESRRFTADHAVCAIPFSVLKTLDVSPPFSARKRAAITDLPYTSVTRVFLQSRRRFWTERGWPNSASTDLPIKWVWEPTASQPGERGILESYSAGAAARRIGGMPVSARIQFVLGEVERVFPGITEHFETAAAKVWDADPWARGGYAWLRPGQLTGLSDDVERPEGRVHFAGEHASLWPQWMQGALASGLRAAREIDEAATRA